jgi:hypothetical protein
VKKKIKKIPGKWELQMLSVYRIDRDDRIKSAYAIGVPELENQRELKKNGKEMEVLSNEFEIKSPISSG